jgi:hypothetical protein
MELWVWLGRRKPKRATTSTLERRAENIMGWKAGWEATVILYVYVGKKPFSLQRHGSACDLGTALECFKGGAEGLGTSLKPFEGFV